MASVSEHYDQHLGPVYSWMMGDPAAAVARGKEELSALGVRPGATGMAVDLGAGPGLHAIPLAELGFSVFAIDTCATLVEELKTRAGEQPIRAAVGDLLEFRRHLSGPVDTVLCMGDTLTHLPTLTAVAALLDDVAAVLAESGLFLATFRDYASMALEGTRRFIPVRCDETRCLTCFLEYGEETVTVYDLLHERSETGWQLRVSSYPKLRLDPAWIEERLGAVGLVVQRDVTPSGMVRVVARQG